MLSTDLLNIKGKVLLLVCCAPCCAGVVKFISDNNLNFTLFFYNPNIYPEDEYVKRKAEVVRIAKIYNVPFVDTDYTPNDYENVVVGLGHLPERSVRCEKCFKLRLLRTAEFARANGFDYFSSTLAVSRWKSLEQVDKMGAEVSELLEFPYLNVNWRKCGLQLVARQVIRENSIYEQNYCGCRYSYRNKK